MFTGVSPGYHTVEVDYPGYGAYIQNVYIEGGSGMEINADLIDLGVIWLDVYRFDSPGCRCVCRWEP